MLLIDLTKKLNLNFQIISNNSKFEITDCVLNSKDANKENIFFAIKGFKTDGHKFIEDAYNKTCRNFIIEDDNFIKSEWKNDSTIIKVFDVRFSLGVISNIINDYPYNKLKMIGITGTKGKTTVTTLIYKFLSQKFNCGMFSTVKNISAGISTDSERTTMEANKLQAMLKKSFEYGETHSIVEVSSHAVTLFRVEGINWDIGIFTSFSRDHLDLYETMENYFQAKLDFFQALNNSTKKNKIAIINIDDPKGYDICSILNNTVRIIKVGTDKNADYKIKNYITDEKGLTINISYNDKDYIFQTPMRGIFNVTNISLALTVALELGVDYEIIQNELKNCRGIDGRFEIIIEKPFKIIVDYAHTPDSIEKILEEGRKLTKSKLITVFGCTGDRDKDKRPIMGKISSNLSDFTFITNDDTYTENPSDIAAAVELGFTESNKKNIIDYKIVLDRKKAIKEAMLFAQPGDIIIIAGMGHEKHQIINNIAIPYSDKETVLSIAEEMKII